MLVSAVFLAIKDDSKTHCISSVFHPTDPIIHNDSTYNLTSSPTALEEIFIATDWTKITLADSEKTSPISENAIAGPACFHIASNNRKNTSAETPSAEN